MKSSCAKTSPDNCIKDVIKVISTPVMIVKRRIAVNPILPFHRETGKCLYSVKRDKALKLDSNPHGDGLSVSQTTLQILIQL